MTTWFRRISRLIMLAGIAAAVYGWWQQQRGSGGSAGGTEPGRGGGGSGGGGGGRSAPIGGPLPPSPLRAEATPEPEPEAVGAPVRSLAGAGAGSEPATVTVTEERAWVEPLEGGACPASHPIKVNVKSGIFHVPGGLNYERTDPARCYATAEAAEADGYRRAKT